MLYAATFYVCSVVNDDFNCLRNFCGYQHVGRKEDRNNNMDGPVGDTLRRHNFTWLEKMGPIATHDGDN